MDTYVVNFYPIAKFIICLFAVVGFWGFLNNLSRIWLNKHTTDKFLEKYPDVTPDYMAKGLRIQNIENNQEIHEINKRLDTLQDIVDDLKDVAESIKEQQDNE